MKPMPHQLVGAKFLASRNRALCADDCRTGKTLTAIMASDYCLDKTILVVTTSSGRSVWRRSFQTLGSIKRSVCVLGVDKNEDADVLIVSWAGLLQSKTIARILARGAFDRIIKDESHKAKNPEAKMTQAAYGKMHNGGALMFTAGSLTELSPKVSWLTATPAPHDPGDLFPMLRAGCPELLEADPAKGWPDVTRYDDFRSRYCVIVMKKISAWNRIPVVIKGRNEAELHERIKPFFIRRTQADIGLTPPTYETLPLIVLPSQRRHIDSLVDHKKVMDAIEAGATKELEMDLGPLRRLTGAIKAHAVVEAVKDELNGGLDKIVLMRWHSEVGQIIRDGLAEFGVVSLDGSSTLKERQEAERAFRDDPKVRVFDGQIQAAGEAIDLSAARELWFVETIFSPGLLGQAAQRIAGPNQKRSAFVRVCSIEGSIDEALQASVMRLWQSIREVVH
jgi:SNF2 family DNA or RNA helicase